VRKLWLLIYYGIAWHFPTPPMGGVYVRAIYALRQFLVKRIFLSCGEEVMVKQHAYFGNGRTLALGNRAQIGVNAKIEHYVTIEDDVVMGPDVVIMTNSHNFEDLTLPINQQGSPGIKAVRIGRDAWIGTRVVILPGVEIGEGSVIGAGSIVTKSIPPYSVAVGNPAKVIRKRGDRLRAEEGTEGVQHQETTER
jgi:maltose O-acetyltransferase